MASSTVLFHVPLGSVAFLPLPTLPLRLLNFTTLPLFMRTSCPVGNHLIAIDRLDALLGPGLIVCVKLYGRLMERTQSLSGVDNRTGIPA